MSFVRVVHELDTKFHNKILSYLEGASCKQQLFEKSSMQIEYENVTSLE
jgi:hypothetical protein